MSASAITPSPGWGFPSFPPRANFSTVCFAVASWGLYTCSRVLLRPGRTGDLTEGGDVVGRVAAGEFCGGFTDSAGSSFLRCIDGLEGLPARGVEKRSSDSGVGGTRMLGVSNIVLPQSGTLTNFSRSDGTPRTWSFCLHFAAPTRPRVRMPCPLAVVFAPTGNVLALHVCTVHSRSFCYLNDPAFSFQLACACSRLLVR